MNCEICGQIAPFFTETYCPKMQKSRTIWLCKEHQNELFLEVGRWLWTKKEDEKKDRLPQTVYGIGNTPTFIPVPPITYEITMKDLKKREEDK